MDRKIKIKKQAKILESDDFEKYTKEELIERIKSISAHNIQLKNILAKNKHSDKLVSKKEKSFNFSKCTFQHVAIQLLYFGWDYKGYVVQEDSAETIEHHLFEALIKTKLIQDRATSNYHRCGRTDKGVSSFGQVISIDLRSNDSFGEGKKEEINYCKIINRVLPADIQCIAWSPVDETFSARFDCSSRTYKYFFPKGHLNLEQMNTASKKLIGMHDFRNFCKMDVGNGVVEFTRNIMDINIESVDNNKDDYDMCCINIKAKAFLWHQIRCIMGILILIGQGKENPEVVDDLLDVEKYPRKPEYAMASEIPLNLHFCEFENLTWKYDKEVLNEVIEKLNNAWTFKSIKANMMKEIVETLQRKRIELKIDFKEKCLSENLMTFKSKKYTPLLERQTCVGLEDKIDNYKKRKRIEIVEDKK